MLTIIKAAFTVAMLTGALLLGNFLIGLPGASATIIYPDNLPRVHTVSNHGWHYVYAPHRWRNLR